MTHDITHERPDSEDLNSVAIHLVTLAKASPGHLHNFEGSRVQVAFQNELNLYFVKEEGQSRSVSWDGHWDAVGHVETLLTTERPEVNIFKDHFALLSGPDWEHVVVANHTATITLDRQSLPELIQGLMSTMSAAEYQDTLDLIT